MIFNGLRSTSKKSLGGEYLDSTDAAIIEHFGHFESATKESMLVDIQSMIDAGKKGKIVIVKAWPGFSFLDPDFMKLPLSQKKEIAASNLLFPLAAFLAGAQEYSYLIYTWGYNIYDGSLEWYPEFDRPLGKPLGDATVSGWEMTRYFEHAKVWVNLETK